MMNGYSFFDLLTQALPADVQPQELLGLAPAEMWAKDAILAAKYVLRKSLRINWDAYLAQYPDLQQKDLDPCAHFIEHGIYEGRKLISWHPLKQPEQPGAPLASIVIANYNNAQYLEKCLESCIAQTLKDIEIIVVDDASSDDSMAILTDFAKLHGNVKIRQHEANMGIVSVRRDGIFLASGRYIVFLDSDDFLAPNACETLFKHARQGYDIVQCNFLILNCGEIPAAQMQATEEFFNRGKRRLYKDALKAIYVDKELRWNIIGNMILREICVSIAKTMPNKKLAMAEDVYIMAGISSQTRSLLKIKDELYIYRHNVGISALDKKDQSFAPFLNLGDTTIELEHYAREHALNIKIEDIKYDHCKRAIEMWLRYADPFKAEDYLLQLHAQYGTELFFNVLIHNYQDKQRLIANKLAAQPHSPLANKTIQKRIAIFYNRLSYGGIEKMLSNIAFILHDNLYKITVFYEEETDTRIALPADIELTHVKSGVGGNCEINEHVAEFNQILTEHKFDVIIYMGAQSNYVLWDIILFRIHKLPVILNYHGNFCRPFMFNLHGYDHHDAEAVFRCADAATCVCTATERYLRSQGINAWSIPNPIYPAPESYAPPQFSQNIAVIGRFGDWVKQAGDALHIFKRSAREFPASKLYLIGDFDDSTRHEFFDLINNLGIASRVVLTGWTDNPNYYLKQCGILLSTAYWESFALGIAEAQAMGLPCVIYDVPIEQCKDNESIIVVPQGDTRRATNAIGEILQDEQRWRKLSVIAKEKIKRFSPEQFAQNILRIIGNFYLYSPWRQPRCEEYETILKYASFYVDRKPNFCWHRHIEDA